MKKTLLTLMALFALPALMSAGSSGTNEPIPFDFEYKAIYYGTEASTHPNNPCKGATVRKCAELDTQIASEGIATSLVTYTLKNSVGEIKYVSSQTVPTPAEQVLNDHINNLPANAEVVYIRR